MKSSGNPLNLRRGAWDPAEDTLLRKWIEKHGEGKWHLVSKRSGLSRCRKSCRLRWLNYLRPTIKRGDFDADEVDLMMRLHRLLGNKWTLIAGRLPGRTGNDVKNFWNTNVKKKLTPARKEKEVMVEGEKLVQRKEDSNANTSSGTCDHEVMEPVRPSTISQGTSLACHNLIPDQKHMSSPNSPGDNIYDSKINNISMLINKPSTPAASKEKEVMVEGKELVQRKEDSNAKTSSGTSAHVVMEPLPLTVSQGTNLHPCHNLIPDQKLMSSPSPGDIICESNYKNNNISMLINKPPTPATWPPDDDGMEWWSTLLGEKEIYGQEEASLKEWGHLDEPMPPATEAIGLLEENSQKNIGWTDDIWNLLNYDYC